MLQSNIDYQRKDLPQSVTKLAWLMLAIGLVLGLLAFWVDFSRAIFNYLINFMFVLSIGVGSLFLVALEYIAGADWSVPFRRVNEFLTSTIPFLILLVIPLFLSMHDLFHWTHEEALASDRVLQGKSPYLNVSFFIIRVLFSFAVWGIFYFLIVRNSLKQDNSHDQILTKKNIRLSAIFIPLFAITITVSAIDWMMSLEPHWFSTIFGVYFFSGTVVGALAALTLIVVLLIEKGYLHKRIIKDHLYSLGALLFAFINFWAYIAFSQFLLIWYADLPEETFWFLHRWEGGWAVLSVALIVFHFIVPYSALLSQPAKMDPKRLKFISIWILIAHYIDLFWLIMPNRTEGTFSFVNLWIELAFPVAFVGILILIFNMRVKKYNLLPVGDPKLEKGLKFRL